MVQNTVVGQHNAAAKNIYFKTPFAKFAHHVVHNTSKLILHIQTQTVSACWGKKNT